MLRFLTRYYHVRNAVFILGEALFLIFSLFISYLLIVGRDELNVNACLFARIFFIVFIFQICLYYNELYNFRTHSTFEDLGCRLFQSLGAASIIIGVFYFFLPEVIIIGRGVSFISIVFIIIFIISWRFLYVIALDRGWMTHKVMLLGSSRLVEHVNENIINNRDCGYDVELVIPEARVGSGLDFGKYISSFGKDLVIL